MRQTAVFVKKEFLESWRSYRVLILAVFFVSFGMLSPFFAKITPALMESLLPEGVSFEFPEPSYLDGWMQYFKNMSQLGLVVIIIVFSGLLADEHHRCTLPMLLTKGLQSRAVVLGKFFAGGIILTGLYLLGFAVCLLYTWIYFKAWASGFIVAGVFAVLLAYLLILAMFLFWGSILPKVSYVLLASLVTLGGMLMANLHHAVPKWNPISLLNMGMQLSGQAADYKGAFLTSIFLIVLFIFGSVFFLQKREI